MARSDHPAKPCPSAPAEVVRRDIGGWISGPSVSGQPVPAEHVRVGDRLAYDGRVIEVTDIRHGTWPFPEGRGQGVAIGWKAERSSGLLFRKNTDVLSKVDGQG